MTTAMDEMAPEAETAPHGRDDNGVPLAPYGLLKNGNPRKSNRGARPGQRGNGGRSRTARAPKTTGVKLANKTDRQRREALLGLMDMLVITPLSGFAMSPVARSRFGERQTTALMGDTVILQQFSPGMADALIILSQTKPGALAWLDQVEEKAPYLALMNVGLQMAKALVENHLHPSDSLAETGGLMMQLKMVELEAAIRQEAAAAGITPYSPNEPTIPIHDDTAA